MDKESFSAGYFCNTGSRSFSRAEIHERMGSSGGVQLITRQTIKADCWSDQRKDVQGCSWSVDQGCCDSAA